MSIAGTESHLSIAARDSGEDSIFRLVFPRNLASLGVNGDDFPSPHRRAFNEIPSPHPKKDEVFVDTRTPPDRIRHPFRPDFLACLRIHCIHAVIAVASAEVNFSVVDDRRDVGVHIGIVPNLLSLQGIDAVNAISTGGEVEFALTDERG